jgi:acyl-CoA reductase-like NAD-dependent aldehyde dehydrogenase
MSTNALKEELIADDPNNPTIKRRIVREPIGPVLALQPWNYPVSL